MRVFPNKWRGCEGKYESKNLNRSGWRIVSSNKLARVHNNSQSKKNLCNQKISIKNNPIIGISCKHSWNCWSTAIVLDYLWEIFRLKMPKLWTKPVTFINDNKPSRNTQVHINPWTLWRFIWVIIFLCESLPNICTHENNPWVKEIYLSIKLIMLSLMI